MNAPIARLPREIKINADLLYDMWLDGVHYGAAIDYQVAEVILDDIEAEGGRQVFTPEQAAIIAEYWPTQAEHLVVKA